MSTRAVALLVFVAATSVQAADKPNVVIFFTDDQGTLDANCYGSKDLYAPTIAELDVLTK
jgi:arylsulfatase A